MPTTNVRKLVLGVFALSLAVSCGKCFWDHGWLSVRVALADEQLAIFDEMRIKASRSDPAEAVGCLAYVMWYYPSGTKQIEGSSLDRIVERARAGAVVVIVADLRKRSGEDLGEDPERWIEHFAAKR